MTFSPSRFRFRHSEATELFAKGHNGQLRFDGQTVTITREGFLARATQGRSTKELPIRSIGAVQFKPANALINGFVQFSVMGEVSVRNNNLGSRTVQAGQDENSVIVVKKQMPAFVALVDAVRAAIADAHQPALTVAAPDVADQLHKLGGLRDAGLLTDAEFDAKKSELLSRM